MGNKRHDRGWNLRTQGLTQGCAGGIAAWRKDSETKQDARLLGGDLVVPEDILTHAYSRTRLAG